MADEIPVSQAALISSESSARIDKRHRLSILRSSQEAKLWYEGLLSPMIDMQLDMRLKGQLKSTVVSIIDYFTQILEANSGIISVIGIGNSRGTVIEIAKLFSSILKNYLIHSSSDGSNLFQNTPFLRSLLALCFELHLFMKEITEISFESIIKFLDISEFDFWKQINFFANLYQPIPGLFLVHLKELDYKITTETAWKRHSSFFMKVQRSFNNSNCKSKEQQSEMNEHNCRLFLKKLAGFVARRIQQVCQHIGFDKAIQEEVWEKSRFFISEQTEYLKDKKIDIVLLCSLYDACKRRCGIHLYTLLKQYKKATGIDKIDHGNQEVESAYKFLNKVYCFAMKTYQVNDQRSFDFRIREFSGCLDKNLTSAPLTPRSPFLMTPRTRKMCNSDDQDDRVPFTLINNKMRRQIEFDYYEKPTKKLINGFS